MIKYPKSPYFLHKRESLGIKCSESQIFARENISYSYCILLIILNKYLRFVHQSCFHQDKVLVLNLGNFHWSCFIERVMETGCTVRIANILWNAVVAVQGVLNGLKTSVL